MASAIPVPGQPGRLYLVPKVPDDVVWESETKPAGGAEAFWVPLAKRWWPVVAVPGVLLVAAYWGPARGPLFRIS